MNKGALVLSNGHIFEGILRGAPIRSNGEVIFNTGMSGYQEILTDPSYTGQIVTMTYPMMGNYGINEEDMESSKVHVAGFVVKEVSEIASNWRSNISLDQWLYKHKVPLLEGIDTRALVRMIRDGGECQGIITPLVEMNTVSSIEAQMAKEVKELPSMEGQNLAKLVSTQKIYRWNAEQTPKKYQIVAYDFGVKYNILRIMSGLDMDITVVPYNTPAEEVLAMKPDGVFLSNGPGDPAVVHEAIEAIRQLLGRLPIFGICLGHQLLALALGCKTYKLKFGHHGLNHPVKDYQTNKIEITSQNHGFAVDESTMGTKVRVTHRNLNDQTIEGIESLDYPAYSVQYHPEAAPGPHDSQYLFNRFLESLKKN